MGMKQNNDNVSFSNAYKDSDRSGYIYYAPKGTPLPTKVDDVLDPSVYKGIGYISEDGLVEPAALSLADPIKESDGSSVARPDPTFDKTWTGTALEALNVDLLTAAYGSGNVKVDKSSKAITVDQKTITPEHRVFVIDELLKNKRKCRHVMPDATFVVTDDISHVSTALVTYGFTLSAYETEDYPAQRDFYSA